MATTTKKKMKNRTVAIIAGIGVAVLGGGIAFAYFTGVGSGSGTATVGSNNPITVNQTSAVTAMGPGIAPQALSGNFTNNNGGPVFIGSVSAQVTGVPAGTPSPGPIACTAADFEIKGGNGGAAPFNNVWTTQVKREVPVGANVDTWSGLTLQFKNNPAANQDACKNASITITYTANAS